MKDAESGRAWAGWRAAGGAARRSYAFILARELLGLTPRCNVCTHLELGAQAPRAGINPISTSSPRQLARRAEQGPGRHSGGLVADRQQQSRRRPPRRHGGPGPPPDEIGGVFASFPRSAATSMLLRLNDDLSFELKLPPSLERTSRRAAAGPNQTLFLHGSGGQLDVYKLRLDTGEIRPLGVPDVRPWHGIVHDGHRSLLIYWTANIVRRVDDETGATEKLKLDVPPDCGPFAAHRDTLFLACRRQHEQAWADAVTELQPGSVWPPPGTFYPELVRVDLTTGQAVPLPAPPDGWAATALALDRRGILYVAEPSRQRVRAIALDRNEVIDVVGRAGSKGVQLGPLPASLNYPVDIAVLPSGALAIADFNEGVILVAK
jgi:hypothetical protein